MVAVPGNAESWIWGSTGVYLLSAPQINFLMLCCRLQKRKKLSAWKQVLIKTGKQKGGEEAFLFAEIPLFWTHSRANVVQIFSTTYHLWKNMSWIRCILWRQYRVCLFLEQRYPAYSIVPSVLQPSRTYRPYLRSWALCAKQRTNSQWKDKKANNAGP